MPAYLVQLPSAEASPGRTLVDGVDTMVVFAADATDAKAVAKSQTDGDLEALWDAATVTEIVAGADLIGWTLRIAMSDADVNPDTGVKDTIFDLSVVGAGANNTIDEIAALMVTALNATAPIAGAAYDSSGQVLKIADDSDNLGKNTVIVEWYPPNAQQNVPVPGLVVSIADGAVSDATDVTVTFAADAFVVPASAGSFKAS